MALLRKRTNNPETSVIIRTKNEEKWLGVVLAVLKEQTYQDFEIIIVDSGSDDQTLKIAQEFKTRVIEIPPEEFSYPHALNVGCREARATKYLVFLSAHSIPVSKTWLEDGIEDFSKYPNIMGVYGNTKALPKTTVWDKIFVSGSYYLQRLARARRCHLKIKGGMGIIGFTNAIILKELWEKHNFDECYGFGGEDGAWANYWFDRSFRAINDIKFTVMHSHNLSPRGHLKQWKYWEKTANPFPFQPLDFRKDRAHIPLPKR